MFPVSLEKEKALRSKLDSLNIFERDIDESFIRSGGHGGQNVNKVATCVFLRHRPTGIEVKCQKARTQGMNRYHARVMLFEKIDRAIKGRESEAAKKIAKIRRQKSRRSRRSREKILADKKHVSAIKASRSQVPDPDPDD